MHLFTCIVFLAISISTIINAHVNHIPSPIAIELAKKDTVITTTSTSSRRELFTSITPPCGDSTSTSQSGDVWGWACPMTGATVMSTTSVGVASATSLPSSSAAKATSTGAAGRLKGGRPMLKGAVVLAGMAMIL